MPQGSSSTSDPRDKLPKGEMEHWVPLIADGLDCGHFYQDPGCFPGCPRVRLPHVALRPWSYSSTVATQEEILPSSCFRKKQLRTTDIRCPPSIASGLDSHLQSLAHSILQITLSKYDLGGGRRSWLCAATQELHQERQRFSGIKPYKGSDVCTNWCGQWHIDRKQMKRECGSF